MGRVQQQKPVLMKYSKISNSNSSKDVVSGGGMTAG